MDIYARILEERESLKTIDRPTKPIGTLLKEYDRLIDQNYRRACQEDRRRLYEETFYNPAYVKSFMEEFDKHEKH